MWWSANQPTNTQGWYNTIMGKQRWVTLDARVLWPHRQRRSSMQPRIWQPNAPGHARILSRRMLEESTSASEDFENISIQVQRTIVYIDRATSIGIRGSLAMSVDAIPLSLCSVPLTVTKTRMHTWLC